MLLLYFIFIAYFLITLLFIIAWEQTSKSKEHYITNNKILVSVIISMRDEVHHIEYLLHDLINQNYPSDMFEVIIVDDDSGDGSYELVQKFQADHSLNILLLRNQTDPAILSPKKRAITQAIKQAKGELIVCTDADCRVSSEWLSAYVNCYTQTGAKFISGGVTFFREQNFFDYCQTVEFASLIGSGAACIKLGFPNMCNGANLAYPKAIFEEMEGYKGSEHLPSGDDEFLMHKIVKAYPDKIVFLRNQKNIVQTQSQPDLKSFFHQRIRWASKWEHYQDWKVKATAFFIFLINLCMLLLPLMAVFQQISWSVFFSLMSAKFLVEFVFLSRVLTFLNKKHTIPFILPVFLVYPFYVVFFGLLARVLPYEWKGRK